MMDRLRAYYKEQKVNTQAFEAVLAVQPESPYDFHLRVEALNLFTNNQASESLIEANKRIANMLKDHNNLSTEVDDSILLESAEKDLYNATKALSERILNSTDYAQNMNELIGLKDSIDAFFDKVMVNADDANLKEARLNLINWVRVLFLSVADVSHLSS